MAELGGHMRLKLRFRKADAEVATAVRRAWVVFMARIENDAKRRSPVDLGHNKNRISTEVKASGAAGRIKAKIFTESGYGGFLEVGTGVHGPKGRPIKPKRGRFLVWKDRRTKKLIFAKQVRGVKAQPYIVPSVIANKRTLISDLRKALK